MPSVVIDGVEYAPKALNKEEDIARAFPIGRIVKITGSSRGNGGVGSYGIGGVGSYGIVRGYSGGALVVHVPTATELSAHTCSDILGEGCFGWWVNPGDLELMP